MNDVVNLSSKAPVAVVGANGYSGMELVRLLSKHPYAELKACFVRTLDDSLILNAGDWNSSRNIAFLPMEELEERSQEFSALFLATPADVSMEIVSRVLGKGFKEKRKSTQIIDLSGAFRLDKDSFEKAYGEKHIASAFLNEFQYGLVPWLDIAQSANLVANPGCYATSILMALLPLMKERLIDPASIVIDAKSGTTGAGKKAKEGLLFSEVEGDCLPYRVGQHQHLPEIVRYVAKFAGIEFSPHFSTSLLPVRRGIISAIYGRISPHIVQKGPALENLFHEVFQNYYKNYPLVRFGKLGQSENKDKALLSLRSVVGSCRTHISYSVKDEKVYLFATLDNLLKGAASQAIENWNIANGFSVEAGLMNSEVFI